jgi:hypothetical protein
MSLSIDRTRSTAPLNDLTLRASALKVGFVTEAEFDHVDESLERLSGLDDPAAHNPYIV